ncbi:P-loop containing nucleoside triphosphate hydrolase protein [Ceraceosorus guamensis]|uniref:gluconokinase n=1 Tax=Ceraceosorus guamensis TaxID=1522189 RepID=A0A316W2M8_9BASI|nr:P-loop containing nucleoside triphosphate hydrolase protein [Ceraceosorus guamensis]PWN44126.1 P-loop containing nucleoside triphosphate hydrolase protein [Ceraceosorus guamensis]
MAQAQQASLQHRQPGSGSGSGGEAQLCSSALRICQDALQQRDRDEEVDGRGSQDEGQAILFIVMGVSGSGKSTLGQHLACALQCAFLDADDLHSPRNVAKMSRGEALEDGDRWDWLKSVREEGVRVARRGLQGAGHAISQKRVAEADGEKGEEMEMDMDMEVTKRRELAEVRETAGLRQEQHPHPHPHSHPQVEHHDASSSPHDSLHTLAASKISAYSSLAPRSSSNERRANCAVIACSALKRIYRDILRGGASNKSANVRTYHLYLRVAPSELHRRLTHRRGHFMKDVLLNSQLDTLQEPTHQDEADCFVLGADEHATSGASSQLRKEQREQRDLKAKVELMLDRDILAQLGRASSTSSPPTATASGTTSTNSNCKSSSTTQQQPKAQAKLLHAQNLSLPLSVSSFPTSSTSANRSTDTSALESLSRALEELQTDLNARLTEVKEMLEGAGGEKSTHSGFFGKGAAEEEEEDEEDEEGDMKE